MLIIADKNIPAAAKEKLAKFGELVEFATESITNDYLSGHPDLFFTKTPNGLIVAPNLPEKFKSILQQKHIKFSEGEKAVAENYPYCATYNCALTSKFIIHKKEITDKGITKNNSSLELINVPQGMTRCSLIPLKGKSGITSDKGIYTELVKRGFNILYVEPNDILLPGMNYGLFGGTAGIFDDKVFIIGSLDKFKLGTAVRNFLIESNYKIIELYDGPLFDGGSLIFI